MSSTSAQIKTQNLPRNKLIEFGPLTNEAINYAASKGVRPTICRDTTGIVLYKNYEICAVVFLDNWSPNSCMAHIWLKNSFVIRDGFFEEIFSFVFNKAKRQKMIASVLDTDDRTLKLVRYLGFDEIFRINDGFDVGQDYIFFELNKKDCRYI